MSPTKLSAWYQQLSQQSGAGLGVAEALRSSGGPPAGDLRAMAGELEGGRALDAVLRDAPRWLPKADRFLLSAAAQSGRWPEVTAQLSTHHRSRAEQQKAVLGAVAYPLFVLHFAILTLPVQSAMGYQEGAGFVFDGGAYVRSAGLGLAVLWGSFFVVREFVRRAPRGTQRVMRFLPGLRTFSKARGLSRFAWSLEALLNAGVSMGDAFGGAALIADDVTLTPALLGRLPDLERGRLPSQILADVRAVPVEFTRLYQTGERTGQLDLTLERLSQQYEEVARSGLKSAAFWYPKLLFLIVAIILGLAMIQAYGGYLEQFEEFF